MVLAGFVTACRFASWPTRRSPVLVNATTDGTVRPPSADVMTVGSPPSMTATTEFVVPRSMPMILPMSLVAPCGARGSGRGVGCGGGHGHEGRADDAVAQAIAAPDLLDDGAVRLAGARHVGDRLVLAGVEWPAGGRVDRGHAFALEEQAQL